MYTTKRKNLYIQIAAAHVFHSSNNIILSCKSTYNQNYI